MKLPVLWIVAALAAGILLGSLLPAKPVVWLLLAAGGLFVGLELWRRGWLAAALVAGVVAWTFLGAAAVRFEQVARRPNLVADLIAAGRLDTGEALRWRGRLRLDPVPLPWGTRYDIDLENVQLAGAPLDVSGGLRVSLFANERLANEKRSEPPISLRAGDRVEALLVARVPHNYGNPGAFDFRGYLARQNIFLTGTLRSAELLRKVAEPPPTVWHRLARVRGRLLGRLDSLFSAAPDQAAVLRAMLLGDRTFIDHERANAFQRSATYHVLVIAGLHVAALAAFLLWAGRRLRLSLMASTLLTLLTLAAYVAVIEDRPPILRAALMAGFFLCARLLFRRVELLNSIALAALIILIARPSALSDPSFQLSFLTVGTIGALAVPWIERTSEPYLRALDHLSDVTRDSRHAPRVTQFRLDARAAAAWLARKLVLHRAAWATTVVTLPCRGALRLWEIFVLSATIQLGMMPMLAYYFHRVSLNGPLANIPAVLLTGLIVPLGFLTLVIGFVWTAAAGAAAKLLGLLVAALVTSAGWFAGWHWASYRIPGPPVMLMAAFFLCVILMAAAARATRRRWQLIVAVPLGLLGLTVATFPFPPRLERGQLELTILDVGQGDSLFAAFPDGRTMLIDAGGTAAQRVGGMRTGSDIGEQVVSPYLWSRGLKRIDVVALTHAHQDHLGGLHAVLENFGVRELWVSRDVSSPAFRALLDEARARGVRVVHHHRGDDFRWGAVDGRILWPELMEESAAGKNNDSFVMRLAFGDEALLLPGDIEGPVERKLIADHDLLSADFLKVAHHGSKTSTAAGLLTETAPKFAAISVGETNPFGHPHPDVLERLRTAGVRVLRTDRDGAISVSSDGQTLRVHSFYEAR